MSCRVLRINKKRFSLGGHNNVNVMSMSFILHSRTSNYQDRRKLKRVHVFQVRQKKTLRIYSAIILLGMIYLSTQRKNHQ